MIEYFRTDDNGTLLKLGQEEPGCWIALFDPDVKELADIATRFTVDLDGLRAPLDREEISRIEREDSYTMFIVDTPIHDESLGEHGYTTIPLGIIQTPTNVISVCSVLRIKVISRLKSRRDLHPTTDIPGFTSDLLISSSGAYASMLRALNKRRIALAAVDQNPSRRNLEELYTLDASLVFFKTSLATNKTVFERFRRTLAADQDERALDLIDDVIVENSQMLETTSLYSEILDSTIDHFGLMMDYDLNHTMMLVAAITLVLCVPTVIGGLFGMNVGGIPFGDKVYGFATVTGITALILLAVLALLKKLRWF